MQTNLNSYFSRKKKFSWTDFKKKNLAMSYTIMLVPHSHKKPIHIKLPVGILLGAFLSLFVLLCFASYFAYSSYHLQQVAVENTGLRKISEEQAQQLESLAAQTEEVVLRLEALAQSESAIRQKVGLAEEEDGMGGRPSLSVDTGDIQADYKKSGDLSLQKQLATLSRKLSHLSIHMDWEEDNLSQFKVQVDEQMNFLESIPMRWPILTGRITSTFGDRDNPFGGTGEEFHNAMDVAAATGTPIYASGKGVVITAGYEKSYGNTVLIDHGYGYTSRYAHCSSLDVSPGDQVSYGDLLGKVGSTGRSTGPHLHFEVTYQGAVIDPETLLEDLPEGITRPAKEGQASD